MENTTDVVVNTDTSAAAAADRREAELISQVALDPHGRDPGQVQLGRGLKLVLNYFHDRAMGLGFTPAEAEEIRLASDALDLPPAA